MAALPSIIVAGGEAVYIDLMERFPREVCRLVYCATLGQVLDRVPEARLAVIDATISGGAEELCRRIRLEPTTSHVGLIVRGSPQNDSAYADQIVDADDFDRLVEEIIARCPELAAAPPTAFEQQAAYDVVPSTGAAPDPAGDAEAPTGSWPPPPPLVGGDVLEHLRTYAAYIAQLLSDFAKLDTLPPGEALALNQVAGEAARNADEVLTLSQRAINEALMNTDLKRSRQLTTGRNALFEQVQRLRAKVSVPATKPAPPPLPDHLESPAATRQPPKGKSELTKAAERRQAEQARAAALARRAARPRRVTGSARRTGTSRLIPVLLAIGVGVLLVGGVFALLWRSGTESAAQAPGENQAPQMKFVRLEQTPHGIVARVAAVDPNRDPISYVIYWTVDSRRIDGARSTRLPTKHYKPGDQVQAYVTPTDPYAQGTAMVSQPLTVSRSGHARRSEPRQGQAN